jgi:hypothetical protein
MVGHESLFSYYQNNFNLTHHHKYSLTEIEEMIPMEREIYISLLNNWIEQENTRIQQQINSRK